MANIRTYEGWWDLSLIDQRNERPLLAAFVAAILVWTTAYRVTGVRARSLRESSTARLHR
jgi:hypothetical protein